VAFNADSFGHPGTLPQIIRQQGMVNYVFMRPDLREKTLPSDLFWWEGPDGTQVLTYRIQESYNAGRELNGRFDNILKLAPTQPMTDFMAFFGVGDHGGGPTQANIQSIDAKKEEKEAPVIKYSTIEKYFEVVRAKNLKLPVVKDDLQHHAVGCYSADGIIKKYNRLSEAALVKAEKIAAVGSLVWGAHYPREKFTDAWKQVLQLQFHDSLAGTSVVVHTQDATEGYNYAINIAHTAIRMAAQKLEWQIAAEDPDSEYLVVFNPHAWDVKTNVEYDLNSKPNPIITDDLDRVLPSQIVQAQSVTGRRRYLFNTEIPAMGYRQFRVRRGESTTAASKVSADNYRLENEFYRISFSPDGYIGIFDREANREVFKGGATGCRGVIIDDPSDTWSHEVVDFTKSTTGPYNYQTKGETGAFGRAHMKVIENGPVRAVIRVRNTCGDSDMTIDWMLTAGSRNIEALVTLNWHEKLKMVKFSFPVDIENPQATYEVPYGVITRATKGEEDPGQRWIDLTGQSGAGAYGLTVFNDAKYGYSVHAHDMRITVSRSAPFAHHGPRQLAQMDPDGKCSWQDQGIQTFRLLLTPHKGSWQDINAPRIAEEFISPPVPVYQGIHGGKMRKSGSFLSVDAPNVIVSAIKMSEQQNDAIIRLVETAGKASTVTLRFPSVNYQWNGNIKPFEIKTLRMNTQSGNVREVNLLEE
jgi:alpha-mannosidase